MLQRPRFLRSEDDSGYLLRVLRNTRVSGRRRAARRPQRLDAPDELMRIEELSAAQPEVKLDSGTLYQAIAALPVPFRDALVAVDVIGMSYEEAARALRAREATITTRLHRARQRVAAALAEESGISPAVQRSAVDAATRTAT